MKRMSRCLAAAALILLSGPVATQAGQEPVSVWILPSPSAIY